MSSDAIWTTKTQGARIARWQALWAMEDLPRPIWFVPADAMLALPLEWARAQKPVDVLFRSKETQVGAPRAAAPHP